MAALTQQFLKSLAINLDEQTYQAFNEHFESTLDERVIESILDELDEQQLAELSALRSDSDDKLQAWLQANVPNLNEIIREEVDILLGDIAEDSEQF